MLRDDGLFYLMDTVYSFKTEHYKSFFDDKMTALSQQLSREFTLEVAQAIREENSTLDWIMEGLLTRAGFAIEKSEYPEGMLARYWCRKIAVERGE